MADKLSSKKHASILAQRIIPDVLGNKVKAASQPRLILLGGQPGAGKGGLRRNVKTNLTSPAEIDIDDLRIYHPQYRDFVDEDPATAASRVQADCSEWAAELFEEAVSRGLNVIYDGTLSVSSKAVGMAKSASKAGYGVEVHVVATSSDVSQQGVQQRYEQARDAWDPDDPGAVPPRTVPARIQQSAYDSIPGTLEDLCASGAVSRMRVADRSGKAVSDVTGKAAVKRDGPKQSKGALAAERDRVWTQTEIDEYADHARDIVAAMKKRGAPAKEWQKVERDQQATVTRRGDELTADQVKKDAWVQSVMKFDVAATVPEEDDEELPPLPKKKKKLLI